MVATTAVDGGTVGGRRLAHVPALDGLRGLAVLAVLGYHHGLGSASGGFLGVSLFFTLSGFLITSLLVAEHRHTGSVRLRTFWARRFRRLAPAGLLGLGLAIVATVVAVPESQRAGALADVRYALLHIANWRFVWSDAPYADVGTIPSPVLHYWSLAIEEQFYLVFPVVALLALRRSRTALAGVLVAVVALSLWRQGVLGADRVYFGTDTRAAELAIGALLGLAWPSLAALGGPERRRRSCDALGAVALAATAVLWVAAEQSNAALLGGGLTAVACLSALVLVGALGGHRVPALLAWAPLRWVGIVSYGTYVIHWPVYLVLSPERTGIDGPALLAARLVVTGTVAAASYVVIERPIRSGNLLPARVALPAMLTSFVVLAAATIPFAQGSADGSPLVLRAPALEAAGPAARSAALPRAGADEPAESADHDPAPQPEVASARPPDPAPADAPPPTEVAPVEHQPGRPARLVVLGDSTALGIGVGLQSWGEQNGTLAVSVVGRNGCSVLRGERIRIREGYEVSPDDCADVFVAAVDEARRIDADALVVILGSSQLADIRFPGDPAWRTITEPDIGAAYRRELIATLDLLETARVPILWADLPVPAWDLDAFLGGVTVGEGEPVMNDPVRAATLNELTDPLVSERSGSVYFPYAAGLAGPDGVIDASDRVDGLHLSPEQVHAAADGWLVSLLAQAHDRAVGELGRSPEPLAWSGPR